MTTVAREQAAATMTRRRSRWARPFANRYLYLMLLPTVAFFVIFRYLPMYGAIIAFKDYSFRSGILGSEWVGVKHFVDFFNSYQFGQLFRNTLLISFYKILWGAPVPIILALMLNEVFHLRYKKFVQTSLYLPWFISWVVIGNLVFVFFAQEVGAVSRLIYELTGNKLGILRDPTHYRAVLVATDIWKGAGWGTIIYLAALSGIDPQLYEAATIDGANKWQQVWRITIPGIMSVIVILLVLRVGYILDAGFEQILIMQNAFVAEVTEIIDTYVYKVGLLSGDFSYSTAIGLFKSVVGLVMVILVNQTAKAARVEALW